MVVTAVEEDIVSFVVFFLAGFFWRGSRDACKGSTRVILFCLPCMKTRGWGGGRAGRHVAARVGCATGIRLDLIMARGARRCCRSPSATSDCILASGSRLLVPRELAVATLISTPTLCCQCFLVQLAPVIVRATYASGLHRRPSHLDLETIHVCQEWHRFNSPLSSGSRLSEAALKIRLRYGASFRALKR